ncbi:hypothetical protein [Anaerosporobacter sp.]|uniref:hypothetical protein n=1 Tax=Anaerosporobacter sp. TaxID=1872529 RepID=UPI00286F5B79|nr:hypothetical protein [Anaerosporobacter sp.]
MNTDFNLREGLKVFHRFNNQEERRAYGGSAFLELQYCKMKPDTSIKKIVAVGSVSHWQNDSIYVHMENMEDFYSNYSDIFVDGLYNNMKRGQIDVNGINYYSKMQIFSIVTDLELKKPKEYVLLLEWLKNVVQYNGVYILGI